MSYVVLEEEPVKEEIFSGTFILDGHMSEAEQRNKILKMMEVAGVKVEDENSLEIGFDGVEDDNGISESQTSRFHVFQNVVKKVPYRVTNEEIFRGSLILDPVALTPEQQQEKIFNMMRLSGVDVGDPDTIEINYEGVEDDNGISETQTAPFVVYRVHKEKVDDAVPNKEELEEALNTIKSLRSRLESLVDSEERKKLIEELYQKTEQLENNIGNNVVVEDVEEQFDEFDEQINALQESLKKAVKDYEESIHRMEGIIEEQTKAFELGNHTSEELDALRSEFARRKMEENEKSAQIKKEIEEQKKLLTNLKRKKNKVEKDVHEADDLGISIPDFKEIEATLQKKNIMNAILEQKGLEAVVEKKASERSAEEKKQIKKAKEEVVKEISEAKKEKKDASILNLIEALYSVQVQYVQGKPPRILLVKESQLDQIKKNVEKVPERIVGDAKVYDYHPEEIPIDLAEANMNLHREEVFSGTYILDGERMSEAEQRKKIFDMMRLAGVEVNDESEFEIGYEGVEDNNGLSDTQSTKFVVYRKIKEEKKEDTDKVVEKEEEKKIDLESRGFDERIVFFKDTNNQNAIYVRDYVIKRFNLVPVSEEVRIEESLCYEIDDADAEYIFGNQNNNYSPYFVETREVTLPKEEVVEEIPEKVKTEVVIYHDADNNQEKYVTQDTIVRFNLVPQSDAVEINGESFYRVSEDDASFVIKNQDNNYSPYHVDYREAHLGKREEVVSTTDRAPRNDLIERITLYRDLDNNNEVYVKKYVVERFNLIPVSDQVRINGAVCYRIENEDAGYLITNANNGYSPYEVDVEDIELGKRATVDDLVQKLDSNDLVEKIVIYRDITHDNDYYVKKYVCTRFNIVPTGPEVRIMKAACYKVNAEDIDFIIRNAHNNYSPYEVEIVDFSLEKDVVNNQEIFHNDGLIEKMKIYRDLDHGNQIYAKKYTVARFNVVPTGEEVRIQGFLCYPISEEDAMFILSNQNNGYSPYELEIENIHLEEVKDEEKIVSVTPVEEKEEVVKEPVVEEKKEEVAEEPVVEEKEEVAETVEEIKNEIVLYRNPDDASELYANKETLTRFGIFPSGGPIVIEGENYYPIRVEDEKRIRDFISQVMDLNTVVTYRDVPVQQEEITEEEKNQSEYEKIMEKLMISPNEVGASRYTPTNIRPTGKFIDELKEGDWVYNIVHFLSSARKVSSDFLKKLSEKILGTREGKNSLNAFQKRVDSLTDEEIEVLLKEYHDSHAAYQANQMVVERIHEYLYDKMSKYERSICDEYEKLYTLLGQIRVIEETLKTGGLSDRAVSCFNRERDNKLIIVSEIAKNIVKEREEIQRLLGDNLSNLPELNRYPFAMLPYNKNLPKEYQNRLTEYQAGFRDAVNRNRMDEIAANFMGMESCYYQSSDVAVRMVDNGEVGTKYFAPVVEEFGFRDDPFERDLFRVSTASAVVVHDVELTQRNRVFELPNEAIIVHPEEFDSSVLRRENLVTPEINDELDKILLEYGSGTMSREEALYQLDKVSRHNQSLLVSTVNEIIAGLKPYAASHPEFDFEKIQTALEYVIAHPECIGSNNNTYKDVLGESLYGLPKDLLSNLISCASAVTLAHDVADTMKKKYQANELNDMFQTPVEEGEKNFHK